MRKGRNKVPLGMFQKVLTGNDATVTKPRALADEEY